MVLVELVILVITTSGWASVVTRLIELLENTYMMYLVLSTITILHWQCCMHSLSLPYKQVNKRTSGSIPCGLHVIFTPWSPD